MSYLIYNEDCFQTFERLSDCSVDLVLSDPPYGITQSKWDNPIHLGRMWSSLRRIIKPNGVIVLTCNQPFTSVLILSNSKMFKYCWVWNKVNKITGFLNAKKSPLRVTEDIAVFYRSQPTYNPQMIGGMPYKATSGGNTDNYNDHKSNITISNGDRYPLSLISLPGDERGTVGRLHPTQKPVGLMRYLMRTYTNSGDLVLDFAMGSGTTGVAAGELRREFIGCDNDVEQGYFEIAKSRISKAYGE